MEINETDDLRIVEKYIYSIRRFLYQFRSILKHYIQDEDLQCLQFDFWMH